MGLQGLPLDHVSSANEDRTSKREHRHQTSLGLCLTGISRYRNSVLRRLVQTHHRVLDYTDQQFPMHRFDQSPDYKGRVQSVVGHNHAGHRFTDVDTLITSAQAKAYPVRYFLTGHLRHYREYTEQLLLVRQPLQADLGLLVRSRVVYSNSCRQYAVYMDNFA
jgi:hypothetical protein